MNKMTGLILIGLGIILFITGIIIIYKPKEASASSPTNSFGTPPIHTDNSKQENTSLESDWKNQRNSNFDESKVKGDEFEKYIVKKFNKEYFNIKEWTSDKYIDGIYAETNLNPDLVVELSIGSKSKSFAIECKWRKDFFKGGIEVATDDQIKRYKKFEKDRGIPVFMAIGISGKPSKPNELFIIPLIEITDSFLQKSYMQKFKKENLREGFYFDLETEILK